ncbi:MAG: hypothetical protein ACREX7_03970 [Casimicrobiaceae bacterium]
MTPVRYRIVPADLESHLFESPCTVADPDPPGRAFRLPAWSPGSYPIGELARNFVTVRAFCNGACVPVWPVGREDRACELGIFRPQGARLGTAATPSASAAESSSRNTAVLRSAPSTA